MRGRKGKDIRGREEGEMKEGKGRIWRKGEKGRVMGVRRRIRSVRNGKEIKVKSKESLEKVKNERKHIKGKNAKGYKWNRCEIQQK